MTKRCAREAVGDQPRSGERGAVGSRASVITMIAAGWAVAALMMVGFRFLDSRPVLAIGAFALVLLISVLVLRDVQRNARQEAEPVAAEQRTRTDDDPTADADDIAKPPASMMMKLGTLVAALGAFVAVASVMWNALNAGIGVSAAGSSRGLQYAADKAPDLWVTVLAVTAIFVGTALMSLGSMRRQRRGG